VGLKVMVTHPDLFEGKPTAATVTKQTNDDDGTPTYTLKSVTTGATIKPIYEDNMRLPKPAASAPTAKPSPKVTASKATTKATAKTPEKASDKLGKKLADKKASKK
jgi:hypothetical protein